MVSSRGVVPYMNRGVARFEAVDSVIWSCEYEPGPTVAGVTCFFASLNASLVLLKRLTPLDGDVAEALLKVDVLLARALMPTPGLFARNSRSISITACLRADRCSDRRSAAPGSRPRGVRGDEERRIVAVGCAADMVAFASARGELVDGPDITSRFLSNSELDPFGKVSPSALTDY